jgi:hypothetical protein
MLLAGMPRAASTINLDAAIEMLRKKWSLPAMKVRADLHTEDTICLDRDVSCHAAGRGDFWHRNFATEKWTLIEGQTLVQNS